MSTQTEVEALASAVGADVKTIWTLLNAKAADLAALTTTEKTNLVAAINEVKALADAAGTSNFAPNDSATNSVNGWTSSKIQTEIDAAAAAAEAAATTAAVDQITNGAGPAYDTLIELQNELTGNDTAIANLLTATGNNATAIANLTAAVGDTNADFAAVYVTARDA